MEREVGGGIGIGNTCKPMAVSFQYMTKSTTNKKKKHVNIHMPVHKYSEHHCSEEPKGENSNVHQQMKAKCAGYLMEYYFAMKIF